MNLLFTEKSMMRLIIAFHRLCCVASGVPVEFLFAIGRREIVGLALVDAGSSLSQGFFHGYACAAGGVLFKRPVHPRRGQLHPALGIDEEIARDDDLLTGLEPPGDLDPVAEPPARFHLARLEVAVAAVDEDRLLETRVQNRIGRDRDGRREGDGKLHVR